MYYHPLMLPNLSGERALRTCRAISDVWFDGIERHRAAQSDAAKSDPHGEASMAASGAEVDAEAAHARSTDRRASGRRLQVMA